MPFIEVEDGVNYFYEDRGTGKTIVFIHGWGASGMVWERQVVDFSDHYRVITVDLRGCGKSDKPSHGYAIKDLSKDLYHFIQALKLTDITLVGWSAGGTIVMDYVTRYGDHVEKAVSVGGPVPRYTLTEGFDLGLPKEAMDENLKAMKANRPAVIRGICDANFHQDVGEPMKEWLFQIYMQHSWFVDKTMEDLVHVDLRDKLRDIQIPVAFFHGKQDESVPFALAEYSSKEVPKATLVAFEESAHVPFLEETEKFNQELLSLIQS